MWRNSDRTKRVEKLLSAQFSEESRYRIQSREHNSLRWVQVEPEIDVGRNGSQLCVWPYPGALQAQVHAQSTCTASCPAYAIPTGSDFKEEVVLVSVKSSLGWLLMYTVGSNHWSMPSGFAGINSSPKEGLCNALCSLPATCYRQCLALLEFAEITTFGMSFSPSSTPRELSPHLFTTPK